MKTTRAILSWEAGEFGSGCAVAAMGMGRNRVHRLMQLMGIEAVYPKPKLSQPGEAHKIPDKNHAPAGAAPHIEAKIHLFERLVKQGGEAQNSPFG